MDFPYVLAIGPAGTYSPTTVRVNGVPNPSAEVNTTGWAGNTATLNRVPGPTLGTFAFEVSSTGTSITSGLEATNDSNGRVAITELTAYMASCYVSNIGGPTRGMSIQIQFLDSSGGVLLTSGGLNVLVPNTGATVRLSASVFSPVGAVFARILVRHQTTAGAISNRTIIDQIMMEQGSALLPYFDGGFPDTSSTDYEWLGTPNQSASRATITPFVVASTPTQVLTSFDSWTLDRNFDDGCTLTFSLMGNSLPGIAITELSTDIWLYSRGVLDQRFRVVEVEQTWDADGRNTLQVTSVCYRRLLAARHLTTSLSFVGVSQGQIVWDLIQQTQAQTNGDLGITLSSLGPTVLRDREYTIGQNILEAIIDLSKAENGIAWEIDATLGLIVTQPDLYPSKPQPVQVGTNALNLSKPSGASRFANTVIVSGDTQLTTLVIEQTIGLSSDPRGRWEKYTSYPSAQLQTTLEQQARGLLDSIISPAVVYGFEIETDRFLTDSGYEVGDFTTVVEPSTVIPSTANPSIPSLIIGGTRRSVQILTQTISVSADGNIKIRYNAVQTPQRWDDVPLRIRWDDLDPSITWDNLTELYLT